MFGVLYLLVCLFFGTQLIRFLIPDIRRLYLGISVNQDLMAKTPSLLFVLPAGFVIGLMTVTMVTYYAALGIYRFVPSDMHVLYPANILSMCLFLYLGSLLWQKCYLRKRREYIEETASRKKPGDNRKRQIPVFDRHPGMIILLSLTILAVVAAAAYISFYTFRIEGNQLLVGPSVASDFGPHIAVASSFSTGSNFPTEYPHFPGDKIQYHFFFYFLCGNLKLLGLPLDWAFNLPFILTFVSAVVLLGALAVLLSGRRLAFLVTPLLVLFRSAMNIVYQLIELFKLPGASLQTVFREISQQRDWFSLTPRDEWGLWAINVYANQRHLMLGVSVVLILLFLFIPHVRRMFLHLTKVSGFKEKLRTFFATRQAWIPRKADPLHPYSLLTVALIIGVAAPFFHGSMLISAMLILFGMALFSENRLSYAIAALVSVGSALLQTTLLSGNANNVVSLRLYPGFIAEKVSFSSITDYIFKLGGLAVVIPLVLLIGLSIYEWVRGRIKYRIFLLIAFMFPFIFAFSAQVSREILANHKFVHLSILLFDIFIAGALAFLMLPPIYVRKSRTQTEEKARNNGVYTSRGLCITARIAGVLLSVVLLLALVGTGVSEWFVQHNRNREPIRLDLQSEMVEWIDGNTPERAVFLTRDWYIHSFYLSGRMCYYGWPYYAWSAGHDTDGRFRQYEWLLTGCGGDLELFRQTCAAEGIDYIILDTELLSYRNAAGENIVNSGFFQENLIRVAYFPNENDAQILSVTQ
jgi:hypothetical protein